ncbi:MAG TPA: hypothetical protein VK856_09165, partial [Anaerolineaceae bacterium]|nr:hypothetical protein [Anaerolineaceae bacterium]
MNRLKPIFNFIMILILLVIVVSFTQVSVSAKTNHQEGNPISLGAQIYDDWTSVVVDAPLPVGNHPIWSRQTNNTISGIDTWRCVNCHGWDYQGKEGAFGFGPYSTGFPSILEASGESSVYLVGALSGGSDAQHDFSSLMSEEELESVVSFIQTEVIDDNQYIDIFTRKVIDGNLSNGKEKYEAACASCHGEDGTQATFRYEGREVALGT